MEIFYNKHAKLLNALKSAGIDEPEREFEELLCYCLKVDRMSLYKRVKGLFDKNEAECLEKAVGRRVHREPLQYIVGEVEFYGLTLKIGHGVLVPRPETEILVDEALGILKKPNSRVLDLCTGSGCVALGIARNLPETSVIGVDLSFKALSFGVLNSRMNSIKNAKFLVGDLFEPFSCMESFDFIISNPPYIRSGDIATLQPEVCHYEPSMALDGGPDGLMFYRKILSNASAYLKKGGTIMLEIGFGQADNIEGLAYKYGFRQARFIKDFSNIQRVAIING